MTVNFNADIGESLGNEKSLMPYLDSCNIACGEHAGSISEMKKCVELAVKYGVKIGAHPSYEDRQNFGRVPLSISPDELFKSVKKQIFLLQKIVDDFGTKISHVKPHGALYHKACSNEKTAISVIKAAKSAGITKIVGLPDSVLEKHSNALNCQFIKEGFADRRYRNDGVLVNRKEPNAIITNKSESLKQVKYLVQGKVLTADNAEIKLHVDTICFHGDTKGAVELLKYCHEHLL